MRHLLVRFAAAALLAAFVQPAGAVNWRGDGWFFSDKDSVSRSGDIVTVNEADCHGAGDGDGVDYPTSECVFTQTRINCATGEKRNMTTGQTWMLESWTATIRIYCPQKPAAAVQPAAPAKPAQAAAPKAQSDLKGCETYSDNKKARIAACTRIIESKNPGIADLVSAYHNRCMARLFADEKADAVISDCDRAVTLDPKSVDAVRARGLVNNAAGRLDAAIADLTQAIALKPKDWQFYSNRAQVYLRKKDLQKAIADFTVERNLNASADEALFRMTLCWARASLNVELETALDDCESAVRIRPNDSYAVERRGLVRLRMGNLKEARADADKALALDAKNPRALYLRALVNAREGKTMASSDDRSAALKISEWLAKEHDDIGLKLIVQAENAPFCPAMTALIKAAGERAASKAKTDVAMPGATYCIALDRGYWCTWATGAAGAAAKQKTLATAAAACLAGYTRKDSNSLSGPAAEFALAATKVTVGTMYELKSKSIVAAGIAVSITKPDAKTANEPAAKPAVSARQLQMLKDGCAKGIFSEKECKEAGIAK